MRRLVHELHPCRKSKSKFVILMEAWPIRRSKVFMSGPARKSLSEMKWAVAQLDAHAIQKQAGPRLTLLPNVVWLAE